MVNKKQAKQHEPLKPGSSELEPATAPNPKKAAKADAADAATVPQPTPYAGRMVRFVSRDQFIAAAHSGEAEFSPAMIARVLPTKGPDDSAFRCDLVVFDPEREGGSYVERGVTPFDGTGPGYEVLEQPIAIKVGVEPLKPIVALIIEDYLAQRDSEDSRYDTDSIKQLVADEVRAVLAAEQGKKKDKE